jgi:hypothetical protein
MDPKIPAIARFMQQINCTKEVVVPLLRPSTSPTPQNRCPFARVVTPNIANQSTRFQRPGALEPLQFSSHYAPQNPAESSSIATVLQYTKTP